MFPKRSIRALVAVSAVVATLHAGAVEYLIKPRVDQRVGYDDNITLRAFNALESASYRLIPGVNLAATGANWRIGGDLSARFDRFESGDFDTDDQAATLTFGHFTPKRQLQVFSSVERKSTRNSEIISTGLFNDANRVNSATIRPVGYWQLNERNGLTIGASASNVQYHTLDFDDYKNYAVDITWSRRFNEKTLFELVAFGSQYDSRPVVELNAVSLFFSPVVGLTQRLAGSTGRESRTIGVELGVERSVNDRLEWSLAAGTRDVDTMDSTLICVATGIGSSQCLTDTSQTVEQDQNSSGLIGRSGLSYTGDRLTYELGFERSVAPAGIGFLLETDVINLQARYQLAEHVRVVTSLMSRESESVTEGAAFAREIRIADASLAWRLSPRWRFGSGLRWRKQDSIFQPQSADSFTVYLTLGYTPKTVQISR